MNKRIQQNITIQKLLALTLVLAGCSRCELGVLPRSPAVRRPVDYGQRSVFVGEQQTARSVQHAMELAGDVLVGMHFTIEKADARNGIIRTRPLPGAQFFEFWRSDNVGPDNTLAANLHTIRRTVTLNISRQDKLLHINCEVHTQRLSLPERHLSSSARVYGMFSQSSRSLQRLQLNPEQAKEMEWIDLGRDSQLEAEILKRIETQIIKRTNQRLQTTETKT